MRNKKDTILAYNLARELHRNYLECWDKNKKAVSAWLKKFKTNYKTEISKFPEKCKIISSTRKKICELTNEEQSSKNNPPEITVSVGIENVMLTHIRDYDNFRYNCKCKMCILKIMQHIIYNNFRDLKKPYPKSWDENKQRQ